MLPMSGSRICHSDLVGQWEVIRDGGICRFHDFLSWCLPPTRLVGIRDTVLANDTVTERIGGVRIFGIAKPSPTMRS